MNDTITAELEQPQVLETVVMEPQPDAAIATAGDAPITPVYDNEALKAIVQQALQDAADPTAMVTDAVVNRVIARIQGYIPNDQREFYQKVLGSNSFQSHLSAVVRRYFADTDMRLKTHEEVDRYLAEDAKQTIEMITQIEVDAATRRVTGSSYLDNAKARLINDLERVAAEMRQEQDASRLLATAVAPQLGSLARAHLQNEGGATLKEVTDRLERLAAREREAGILGARLPIRRATQDHTMGRYYIEGLLDCPLPESLSTLYDYLGAYQLLHEISRPFRQAPAGNWLAFGYTSMPLEHIVHLMGSPDPAARRLQWPLTECRGEAGALVFLRYAAGMMAVLDALHGSKTMSMGHWCAHPMKLHISNNTRLGQHLLSFGLRASNSGNRIIQVRGIDFRDVPMKAEFGYNQLHVLHE